MDTFRTIIRIEESDSRLSYNTPVLLIGSCFAHEIGRRMTDAKLPVLPNPMGILYNPASIEKALFRLMSATLYEEKELFFHQGLWHSYDHHSQFSHPKKEVVLELINTSLIQGARCLRHARFLFVTFGTAWVYTLLETSQVVGNCHKKPAADFVRSLLTVDRIVDSWKVLIENLQRFNPNLIVVFTVSPIRHLKEGAHGNQISKSTLLLAINELMQQVKQVRYFPAYELMMDDLRDYRFYAPDMTHPTMQAIDYIWQRFKDTFVDAETQEIVQAWFKVKRFLDHRPMFPQTEVAYDLLINKMNSLCDFREKYPYVDLDQEEDALKKEMVKIIPQ